MQRSRTRLLYASLLALVLCACGIAAASAAAAPTVTVRVEGQSETLLPATRVTLAEPEPVSGCPADSAAAAINLAVGGDWDHGMVYGHGDFTETLLGETHDFTHESDTWTEWINYKLGGGICEDLLSEGDEVLMVADHTPGPAYAPTRLPLVVSGQPSIVQAGASFSVHVYAVRIPPGGEASPGAGEMVPAEGVTVSGGGASALTGAGGVATLTLANTGTAVLRASGGGDAPSATFSVCVHDGNDGNCGTTAPVKEGTAAQVPAPEAPVEPYRGPFALVAHVDGLLDGHTYPAGAAPRLLAGAISSHSAVSDVSLELRRSYRGRCSSFEGQRERFLGARCGHGWLFRASTGGVFSYLLPSALAPGRYVLDVLAADVLGDRTTLARGTSRIVFYVR